MEKIYYEVQCGTGTIGKNSNYTFDTPEAAIEMATEFKSDPRSHNEKMSDENVIYWQSQTYVVVKKAIITQEIAVV